MSNRPLKGKIRRFAEVYAGNATEAAAQAGVQGTRATQATVGSRWLKDSRVQEVIAARRAGTYQPTVRPDPVAAAPATDAPIPIYLTGGVPLDDVTPLETLRALMTDPTVLASTRARSAELLQRREDAERDANTGDPLAVQQEAMNAALKSRRARDREDPRGSVVELAVRLRQAHPRLSAALHALAAGWTPEAP